MKILSIETSCDETAVSIIEASGTIDNPVFDVLGNALYSQIAKHQDYGGVFPALAKREHGQNLVPMLIEATGLAFEKSKNEHLPHSTLHVVLDETKKRHIREVLEKEGILSDSLFTFFETHEVFDIDAIAVTEGPGLEPALWVGVSFAKALSIALEKPIIPVNHMEGHIVSVLLSEKSPELSPDTSNTSSNISQKRIQFPVLSLLISGGHTELVLSKNWHEYEVIGQTVDDAIGEAFDKVARLMNLPYPGGPKISKLAEESRLNALKEKYMQDSRLGVDAGQGIQPWTLPRPMLKSPDLHFSFSGLKTAVLYAVRDKTRSRDVQYKDAHTKESHASEHVASLLSETEIKTLAEEFENAVTEVLVHKTKKALEQTGAKSLIIGGGVIANTYIRNSCIGLAKQIGVRIFTPSVSLSTDNSIMIGIAGYLRWITNDIHNKHRILEPKDVHVLIAHGTLSL